MRISYLESQLPYISSDSDHWIELQGRHIFRDKSPSQLASQTAGLLTGLLLSSTDHFDVRNLQLDHSFTPLQNIHLYIAVFGSGKASDPAPIGAIVPFSMGRVKEAFSMCLPVEQHPPIAHIQAREDRLKTLLPIDCGLQQTVERHSNLDIEHTNVTRQIPEIYDFISFVDSSDQHQILLGI